MRRQRRAVLPLMLQLLGAATILTPLRAADPIIGAWTLDVRSSKFVRAAPQQQTETYRELASGDIELVLTRVQQDGSSTSETLTWPTGGGAVHDSGGVLPEGLTIVGTLLGPGDWLVTQMMYGKQVSTMHKVISQDGKTMTQTIKIIFQPGEQIQVFHRR